MKIIDIVPGVKVYEDNHFSILFGCPPEIIKHFMLRDISFPDYVVIPDTIHFLGVLQNATEFILYYHLFVLKNYFKGKKLKILGEPLHIKNNRELLRLSLLGPTREEYETIDPLHKCTHYENLYRESRALSLKDNSGNEVLIDGFVDFCSFKDGAIETNDFKLFHRDRNLYEVNGKSIDINFDKEQVPPYDLNPDFVPLMPLKFGIDVLGGASGFTSKKPCAGLVLNYNSEYMLIDCVPYLEHSLKARGISLNQIKSIFLSHIHDDHCNIFPLVLFHERIKFLCTKEIFWMACKKLSLMTMHDIKDFYSYFDFVELEPYKTTDFYGINITPHYTVHSIPTIGATFKMKDNGHSRSIVFVGDNKSLPEIKKMVDAGTVKEEKYQQLHSLYHDKYDLFIADGGMGILHGDPKDSIKSKSDRVVFLHMEKLPEKFNTTFSTAIHGKRFTLKEGSNKAYIIKTIHILNHHYPGISREWQTAILNNMNLSKYNTGDVIMKQGEPSNGNTYVILSGNVLILYHDGKGLHEYAQNQAGDLVGEMAIINQVKTRSASLVAGTPVTLGEIDGDVLYAFLKSEKRIESIREMLIIRSKLERLFYNFGISVIANQQIASGAKLIQVEKDQVIVEEGAMGKEFYIILKGSFSVIRKDHEIATLVPGDIFGEFGSLGDTVRNATVKALNEGEVLQIKKDDIIPIIKSTPSLHFHINQIIKDRKEHPSAIQGDHL